MQTSSRKEIIEKTKLLVVKVGTNVLTTKEGYLNVERINSLAKDLCDIRSRGVQVVLVSSGAVGAGMARLNLAERPRDLADLQAVAAIGQGALIQAYEEALVDSRLIAAQILLTADDFTERRRYLTLRNTFASLLNLGALPIVNENDAVSSAELSLTFGDNDRLAALVASLFPEALLILLTDVDGLYDGDPELPDSKIVKCVQEWSPDLMEMVAEKKSRRSKGGMASKLKAAQIVGRAGGAMIIANGSDPAILRKIYNYEEVGTLFLPNKSLPARKRWFQHAAPCGALVVDSGAARAVKELGKSLLPIGVVRSLGVFKKGDVVEIIDENNNEIARGLTNYSSEDARRICRKKSSEIADALDHEGPFYEVIVHRNNLQLAQ